MKRIYFIRHAKSSWKDMSLKDIHRPLNKRGKRDAPFMGQLLKEQGVLPDLIYSSPALRAKTTARIIAEQINYPIERIVIDSAIYEAFSEDLINIVQTTDDSFDSIMLFGHNPSFTHIAYYFGNDVIMNVPTCGILYIEADVESWEAVNGETGNVIRFEYPKKYTEK